MIALAALALAQATPPTITPLPPSRYLRMTDAEFCAEGRRIVAATMSDLPMMVDTITRLDGMSIMCSLRVMTSNKFIMADMSAFREGWRSRKQAQFNDLICGNEAFRVMALRGWRFTQNLTFQSGERVIMDAEPCPRIRRIR